MKYIKIAVIIVFIAALGVYAGALIKERGSRDTTLPEITSDTDVLEISCDYTEEELLSGISAKDDKDGDLTSQVLIGSFSRFIEKGVCDLNYVVFDSANQSASLTRKVKFTDYHSPRFTLTQSLVYQEGEGDYEETMLRIGAEDQLEGNLKEWMTQTDTDVNYQKKGDYHITVQVENSYGDSSSVQLPVHILGEQQTLGIRLSSPLIYINKGENVDTNQLVTEVTDSQGNVLDKGIVTYESSVDSQTPGCYEIYCKADDGMGNTGQTWVTVVVQE